jgi:hypothetical protein
MDPSRALRILMGTLALLLLPAAPGEAAPPPVPTSVAPSGVLAGTTHAFTWEAAATATWYFLWVNDGTAAPALTKWYTAEQASCAEGTGACTVVLSTGLAAGPGRWFVAAWNADGQTWSPGMDFVLSYSPGMWTWPVGTPGRLQLVLGGAAVLDRATGLVWERVVSTQLLKWADALFLCAQKLTAGRKGWRLPTAEEFGALMEFRALPAGHPFTGMADAYFWTATTAPDAMGTNASAFLLNPVTFSFGVGGKQFMNGAWCVRGGQGVDGVQ